MENLHQVSHFNTKHLGLLTTPKTLEPQWRNRLKELRIRSGLHLRKVELSRVKYLKAQRVTRDQPSRLQQKRSHGIPFIVTYNPLSPYLNKIITKYSRLQITRTLPNSKLALTRTKIDFPCITVILPSVTRTLDNSNSRSDSNQFSFPLSSFSIIILPSITRTMFRALKKSGEKPYTGVRNLEF